MKFLVLALCVCAASAASVNSYGNYRPFNRKASAQAVVVSSPVVAPVVPVAKAAAVVAPAPVASVPFVPAPVVKTYTNSEAAVKTYANSEAAAQTLRQEAEVNPDGFSYNFETENGIAAESLGTVKRVGDVESVVFQGSYRYVAPDGTPIVVNYIADENGFQPQSDQLPVAPPVPEPIARALAYIAAHPPAPETVKKF